MVLKQNGFCTDALYRLLENRQTQTCLLSTRPTVKQLNLSNQELKYLGSKYK